MVCATPSSALPTGPSPTVVPVLDPRPPYLFDPAVVDTTVTRLPRTATLIHEKKRKGDPSSAFPRLEKTEREILRILGRAHLYPHLDELLQSLEHCLENNWDAHQLGARDRDEYASLMSDLQVAEHCLARGFTLGSPVGLNIQGAKPDLYVQKGDAKVIIEVFRPRELQSFHDCLTDISRLLKEADIRFDYDASINLDVIDPFDKDGRLVSPWHPIDLDDALEPVVDDALARIAAKLEEIAPAANAEIVEEWPKRNLKILVELTDVRVSVGDEPDRGIGAGKGYGGYEPVGMLARLMPPIVAKAKKRQAGERGDAARILICDVSDTVVSAHLSDEHRKKAFGEILDRELTPRLDHDYDVIALVQRRGWGKPLHLAFAVSADGACDGIIRELFGAFEHV